MFNHIYSATQTVVTTVVNRKDARRYRKEAKQRTAEETTYMIGILESQIKIGPYIPASIPVQVWA